MFKAHTKCRACGSTELTKVFRLCPQPLQNSFKKIGEWQDGFYPLEVLCCEHCGLGQLSVAVDPKILYSNYAFVTNGKSQTVLDHFESFTDDLLLEGGIRGSVVEIASNNGSYLEYLDANGFGNCIGIDPAENLEVLGFYTIKDFFKSDSAKQAGNQLGPPPDYIVARHCFNHVDDVNTFVEALEILAGPETLIAIEVPNPADMLKNNSFDQVYFEHLSYFGVRSMNELLKGSKLHLHKVIRYPIHGGSICMMLRRNESNTIPHVSVSDFLDAENINVKSWRDFAARSTTLMDDLAQFITSKVAEGKTIAGFGASAKSSVWINALGLTKKEIGFICDCTPQKQGRLSPGSDIPIVPEDELLKQMPDFCILWSWNFATEIMEKNKAYTEAGGKWVVPVPELKMYL